AQLSILDSPIVYNPLADASDALETASALYIQAGAVSEASLAYSRPVWKTDAGSLYAGLRGKYYQVALRKTLASVAQFDEAESLLQDEAKVETQGEAGYGLDLGVLWTADNYRVGATFKNVNAPAFSYQTVGKNCESLTGAQKDACHIAISFSDRIDLEEKWVMDPQINIEAAAYNSTRNWFIAGTVDASPVNDAVGNEIQWLTASVGYTGRWKIPAGFRLGYRKNLAGTQLSAATVGLSLLRIIHLDVAWGLETVPVENSNTSGMEGMSEVPRMAQLNLGIDLLF
ncbi:MAG: conjugal transfer protein TraF, partial [Gammaproteobacteria bacterium]|nr:conjugal transfer protein TraF [Gammaproteobacteria bacterium]